MIYCTWKYSRGWKWSKYVPETVKIDDGEIKGEDLSRKIKAKSSNKSIFNNTVLNQLFNNSW